MTWKSDRDQVLAQAAHNIMQANCGDLEFIGLITNGTDIIRVYKDKDGFSVVHGWKETMNQDWRVIEDAEKQA